MPMKVVDSRVRFVVGMTAGMILFIGGYHWCVNDRTAYGWVMFLVVPFVAGFAIALIVRRPAAISLASFIVGIATAMIFIGLQWEGYICVAMAMPFLVVAMCIGNVVGFFIRDQIGEKDITVDKHSALLILACPLMIAAADRVEKPYREAERFETFVNQMFVPKPPDLVWKRLIVFESMGGSQPFLLRIGLPVPNRCTLDKEAVGGRRVCYFNQGIIAQEVTEWNQPFSMKLKVAENTLPGRQWLTFVDASYTLTPVEGGTLVARETTISSRLYPRWYWRMFEAWGVCSEHEYVLANVATPARID